MLVVADEHRRACEVLGQLRLEFGRPAAIGDTLRFCWVVDFPLFDGVDEDGNPQAAHHPFTMPYLEDLDRIETDPFSVRAHSYDLVLNGWELGSGSIRIHRPELQRRIFSALGISAAEAESRFGFLLDAYRYGGPPHAGFAVGLDRLAAIFAGEENIREVIAFPKTQSGSDPMTGGPLPLSDRRLAEIGVRVVADPPAKPAPTPTGASCALGASAMAQRPTSDLFVAAAAEELSRGAPLATRMRPATLDDVVGQHHLVGPGATLRALIEADRLSSAVFFGPAGTGKTTLARIVAARSAKVFVQLSATSAGVKDIRETLEAARRELGTTGRGTILFLDEVHRFNKAQQDALLPGVEEGVVVLIGATTENPFFSLTSPLLSRSTLWRFDAARPRRSSSSSGARRGRAGAGDGRRRGARRLLATSPTATPAAMLTTLEIAVAALAPVAGGRRDVGRTTSRRRGRLPGAPPRRRRALRPHLARFIKSVRGSDPDAGLYWLARLLEAGEDPRFVARRLVILASEDVGMADPLGSRRRRRRPRAAVELVGLPEAALNLAQAVVYLALGAEVELGRRRRCGAAQSDVRVRGPRRRAGHLRGSNYPGAATLGHGVGYEYPHDDPRGWVEADYLPAELVGRRYYEPSEHGAEAGVAERLAALRSLRHDAGVRASSTEGEPGTVRT